MKQDLINNLSYVQNFFPQTQMISKSPKLNDFHKISVEAETHNDDSIYKKQTNTFKVQEQPTHSQYRADIDGLRTIAIAIVLIFHGFPDFMPGGFVGVDVFFIISGYLISGIIFKQAIKNEFSVIDFYQRRIKRIYPALILVILFAFIVVFRTYQEDESKNKLTTMAASSIFAANLQLVLHKTDYFDCNQTTNPFVHLWSLGVEEQFYIVWPCLILLFVDKFRSFVTVFLAIFTIGSFSIGLYTLHYIPKVAFYYPLCRFWEMSIGGLIIYKNIKIHSKTLNDFLSIAGTVAILTVIWFVNEKSHFPGWWALIPTLSSACILMAGPEAFINKHILSSKPFVFIGKISYPLYLWHWPLMVFSRKLFPAGSTSFLGNMYFIIFLSFLLSVLTYYFVENNVRFRKEKKVVLILLIIMIILGLYAKLFVIDSDSQKITEQMILPSLPIYQTDSDEVKSLKLYEKGLVPTENDIVVKNGRKHPNSSKNPKRQPTSVQKIKAARMYFQRFEDSSRTSPILEKKIQKTSQYYSKSVPKQIDIFEVSNEGQKDEVIIVGDSHAKFMAARFQQLYQEAMSRNQTDKFPTVISMSRSGHAYLYQTVRQSVQSQMHMKFTAFFQNYIKERKPKRIFSINRWLGDWKYCIVGCQSGIQAFSPEHNITIKKQIDQFASFMKQFVDIGIEVTVAKIQMDDQRFDPKKMHDVSSIIESRTKPVIYSEFRRQYAQIINYFENSLQKVGVKLIDIADNLCFEDKCEILTPTGYPILADDNHFSFVYTRYWASSVDHLVEF